MARKKSPRRSVAKQVEAEKNAILRMPIGLAKRLDVARNRMIQKVQAAKLDGDMEKTLVDSFTGRGWVPKVIEALVNSYEKVEGYGS